MPNRLIPPALLERLGRRGAVLLLFGLAWLLQGLILGAEGPSGGVDLTASPHENLPFPIMSLLWVASGVLAAAVGLRHSPRDHVGFVAASAPPLILTGSYLVGGVTWFLPGDSGGDPYGLPLALGWAVITLLVGIVASWPEVTEKEPKT